MAELEKEIFCLSSKKIMLLYYHNNRCIIMFLGHASIQWNLDYPD